ncbi:MAG: hypothetical protein FJ398_10995 [Verrucomicrobia bacterium]|nr:hypothetical protein [Verrucomicrobiota bacterium]
MKTNKTSTMAGRFNISAGRWFVTSFDLPVRTCRLTHETARRSHRIETLVERPKLPGRSVPLQTKEPGGFATTVECSR